MLRIALQQRLVHRFFRIVLSGGLPQHFSEACLPREIARSGKSSNHARGFTSNRIGQPDRPVQLQSGAPFPIVVGLRTVISQSVPTSA